ncbi:hypothetical protein QF024_003722 [Chryseobacterium nepalense]|nr:hypothetical protein [Chryseobacterium nepalense]
MLKTQLLYKTKPTAIAVGSLLLLTDYKSQGSEYSSSHSYKIFLNIKNIIAIEYTISKIELILKLI